MKKIAFFTLFLVAGAFAFCEANAVLKDLVGKVEIKLPGGAWEAAEEGMAVPVKSTISTGFNSSATFNLNASVVKVKSLTRMTLEDYAQKEGKESTSLRLASGKIRAEVKSTEGRKVDFTVTSPVATASVRGTSFDFDGNSCETDEGLVVVQNERGEEVPVPAGAATVVSENAPPADPQDIEEQEVTVVAKTTPEVSIIPLADEETEVVPQEAVSDDDTVFSPKGTVQIIIE